MTDFTPVGVGAIGRFNELRPLPDSPQKWLTAPRDTRGSEKSRHWPRADPPVGLDLPDSVPCPGRYPGFLPLHQKDYWRDRPLRSGRAKATRLCLPPGVRESVDPTSQTFKSPLCRGTAGDQPLPAPRSPPADTTPCAPCPPASGVPDSTKPGLETRTETRNRQLCSEKTLFQTERPGLLPERWRAVQTPGYTEEQSERGPHLHLLNLHLRTGRPYVGRALWELTATPTLPGRPLSSPHPLKTTALVLPGGVPPQAYCRFRFLGPKPCI